jgi:hypothetical protein
VESFSRTSSGRSSGGSIATASANELVHPSLAAGDRRELTQLRRQLVSPLFPHLNGDDDESRAECARVEHAAGGHLIGRLRELLSSPSVPVADPAAHVLIDLADAAVVILNLTVYGKPAKDRGCKQRGENGGGDCGDHVPNLVRLLAEGVRTYVR